MNKVEEFYQGKVKILEERLHMSEYDIQGLKKVNERLEIEISKLKSENVNLKIISDIETQKYTLEQNYSKLQKEFASFKETEKQNSETIQDLQEKLSEAETERDQLEEKLIDLELKQEQTEEKLKKHAEEKLQDSCHECERLKSELLKTKTSLD